MIIGIASADYLRSDRTTTGIDAWGGSGFARIGQYIPYLQAAWHTVIAGTLWKEEGCLAVEDGEGNRQFPDLILSQRLMHKGLDEAYKLGRSAGQIVVVDVDDWYWGLSPQNEAFDASHPKKNFVENTLFYKRSLGAASYMTVSTPFLYARMDFGPKVPRTIIPNYVNVSRFTPVEITETDVPEVGWAGSTSHRSGDIEIMSGILGPLATAGRIKIVHSGDYELSPSYASKLGIPEELVSRKTPRVGPEDYPSILNFEVGIIPLRDTPFNEAKSDIKGLEYAAAGIPFVASKLPSYINLYKEWDRIDDNGFFLAKNPAQWIMFLDRLRDPHLRMEMQDRLIHNVMSRDIAVGAKNFIGYLEGLRPR